MAGAQPQWERGGCHVPQKPPRVKATREVPHNLCYATQPPRRERSALAERGGPSLNFEPHEKVSKALGRVCSRGS